jgi:hypothetical protein
MSEISELETIASTLGDLAEEALNYYDRLSNNNVADETLLQIITYSKVLSNYSSFYYQQCAVIALNNALAKLEEINDSTKTALEFLESVERVGQGVKMLVALVNLGSATMIGNVNSITESLNTISEIIEESMHGE